MRPGDVDGGAEDRDTALATHVEFLLTNNSFTARREITTYNLRRSGAEEANAPSAEMLTKTRQ